MEQLSLHFYPIALSHTFLTYYSAHLGRWQQIIVSEWFYYAPGSVQSIFSCIKQIDNNPVEYLSPFDRLGNKSLDKLQNLNSYPQCHKAIVVWERSNNAGGLKLWARYFRASSWAAQRSREEYQKQELSSDPRLFKSISFLQKDGNQLKVILST